jgi:hypothetical protein
MEVVKLEKEHLEVCEKMEKEYSLEVLKCKVVAMLVKKECFEEFECMVVVMLVKVCLVVFECKGLEKWEKEFLEVLVHLEGDCLGKELLEYWEVFQCKVLENSEKVFLEVLEHMEVEK